MGIRPAAALSRSRRPRRRTARAFRGRFGARTVELRVRRAGAGVVLAAGLAAGLAACSSGAPRAGSAATASPAGSAQSEPSTASPSAATGTSPTATRTASHAPSPRLGHWTVGAHPLPLRPDGFGEVLPTPRQLRVRRLPTRDVLPPPHDGRFHATVGPVTAAVRQRMGETWEPGCPVR